MSLYDLAIGGIPNYSPLDHEEGFRFDEEMAQYAIDFIETVCTHVKGPLAKKPFLLEDWEKAIIANLWGWRDLNGLRRYRTAFIYVPKKNGKTAFAAAILLLSMITDGEQGAEIYSAAASREQASLVFQHASGMVKQSPMLRKHLKLYGNSGGAVSKSITFEKTGSFYKPLSADAHTADGVSPHLVICDEIHRHKSPDLADVLEKSMAARVQPLFIHITTADYARESLCNDKLAYAKAVQLNSGDANKPGNDARFLPVIYEATIEMDWTKEETWKLANPNYGVTLQKNFFERQVDEALATPSKQNIFKRLHLNIVTESATTWLQIDKWDKCIVGRSVEDLEGELCFCGLDLASVIDVAAFVAQFPNENGGHDVLCHFWIPANNAIAREKKDKVPYLSWRDAGFLTMTPGDSIDYSFIRQEINAFADKYHIELIGADPWNATQLCTQLVEEDGIRVEMFRQGYKSMSDPCKQLEALVISRKLNHYGNPVLRWMALNAVKVEDSAGNIKVDKSKSTEKIDGIVALIEAIGCGMTEGEDSVYDSCGLTIV